MPTRIQSSQVISLLKDMVRFPSISRDERLLADFMEAYVGKHGVPVSRFDDNIYFWIGEGEDCLLLNTHLDVVPPSFSHPYDPFDPVVVDGMMYGRGTVDAKASGASMTTALLELYAEGWQPRNGRLLVALTTCEETGKAYNGLQELRPHLPTIHAALVGEPTQMQPCVAQKGLLILKIVAHGRTAHAARAHLGENAILKAATDLQKLTTFVLEREDPFLGKTTVTPTVIEGGSARNVVPDRCTIFLDIRTTPAYTHPELTGLFSDYFDNEIEVHSERLVPVHTALSERIVQACIEALPGAEPFGSSTMSDWLFLKDVPAVKIGPGESPLSHAPNEHIALSAVEEAVQGYKTIIKNYFR